MVRIDYYMFDVLVPYRFGGERHRTLREAKTAYKKHLNKGHRVGCMIYGCTKTDDCVSLTFTPWYEDTMNFGKTKVTNIGRIYKAI